MTTKKQNSNIGFTIIELLVVIVIIGILAAITIISYYGITRKAEIATLQSDLSNAANKLKIYKTLYESYPTAIDPTTKCPIAPVVDNGYCLKASNNSNFSVYTSNGTSFFNLTEVSSNGASYTIHDSSISKIASAFGTSDWITIGDQTWNKTNLNVGTMVSSSVNQTNNSILEKYCYDNLESNCTAYGGLYQWDEAMQYITAAGSQGICPTGSHIPTDDDIKILEMKLGMPQDQADATGWRGSDQGSQLKTGGLSGMNMILAGFRHATSGTFNLGSTATIWTSTQTDSLNAFHRWIGNAGIYRTSTSKKFGYSIRCVEN